MTTEEPRIYPLPREEERIAWLENFERDWKPVRELRPKHKLAIKQYYSLKQGHDGTVVLCHFCKKQFSIHDAEIHHSDHIRFKNELSNVLPTCRPCNEDDKAAWMSQHNGEAYARRASILTHREKENNSIAETEQARLKRQAPWTTQLKMRYKQQTIDYLLQCVKESKDFDRATADVEAITDCSHAKAIEYLDSFSKSSFSPFRQWFNDKGQWIAPRDGPVYQKALADYQMRQKDQEQTGL